VLQKTAGDFSPQGKTILLLRALLRQAKSSCPS